MLLCKSAKRVIWGWCLFVAILCLGGCGDRPSEHRSSLYVFGTLVEISAFTQEDSAFQAAVDELDREFQAMHREWHAWKGEGELVRLNRALARSEPFSVSQDMLDLLERGKRYTEQSEGLFNPAMGRLFGLWGFHQDELPEGAPPADSEIAEIVTAAPTMAELQIEGSIIRVDNPQVEIDLGAYAKGYALNRAVEHFRAAGFPHVIVNAGGDLCAAGRHGERPWRIGVRHPRGTGVIASLVLNGQECVLTSGNYERYLAHQGIRYSHILDPRTGYPVKQITSVTVIHRDGALADAAATALSVAGTAEWQRIARQMGVDQVMLVDETGQVLLTPAMQARIQIESEFRDKVVVKPLIQL
ncbi:MAG: FAD:protein FMN transferase [Gammaproteobacteria bacterium]|nr:FAD:protein FMN transferase [Gammaproteobacteria bacterium]